MSRSTNSKVAKQAKACGMTVDQWQQARNQVQQNRGRGRVQHARPESSLWEPVEGQMDMFDTSGNAAAAAGQEWT